MIWITRFDLSLRNFIFLKNIKNFTKITFFFLSKMGPKRGEKKVRKKKLHRILLMQISLLCSTIPCTELSLPNFQRTFTSRRWFCQSDDVRRDKLTAHAGIQVCGCRWLGLGRLYEFRCCYIVCRKLKHLVWEFLVGIWYIILPFAS